MVNGSISGTGRRSLEMGFNETSKLKKKIGSELAQDCRDGANRGQFDHRHVSSKVPNVNFDFDEWFLTLMR